MLGGGQYVCMSHARSPATDKVIGHGNSLKILMGQISKPTRRNTTLSLRDISGSNQGKVMLTLQLVISISYRFIPPLRAMEPTQSAVKCPCSNALERELTMALCRGGGRI
jgi:hypothetical protein